MIVLMVYRPEIRGDLTVDPAAPFEGFEIVGVRNNAFEADAFLTETIARAREAGQDPSKWQWLMERVPESGLPHQPEFAWHGWETGDEVDPPEPGKEWLTITEDGEEYAIIVLRVNASIFDDKPEDLVAARAVREIRANTIVRALNDMVTRGDYP